MFPLLSLAGIALAVSFWPDTSSSSAEPDTAGDVDSQGKSADASDILAAEDHGTDADEERDSDALIPHPEDETLVGTDGEDVLFGYEGEDTLVGGNGADRLDGGQGNDLIDGSDDAEGDLLIGGDGHDQIWIGADDYVVGGSGDDVFHLPDAGAAHIADYNPDDDRIELVYDPAGPKPALLAEPGDTGYNLFADGDLVAVFDGIAEFDLARVHLVPEAA